VSDRDSDSSDGDGDEWDGLDNNGEGREDGTGRAKISPRVAALPLRAAVAAIATIIILAGPLLALAGTGYAVAFAVLYAAAATVVVSIPVALYLFGPSLATVKLGVPVAVLHNLLAQQAYDGSVLVGPEDDSTAYRRVPLETSADGPTKYHVHVNGERIDIEGEGLFRFGWHKFGLIQPRDREFAAATDGMTARSDGGGQWIPLGETTRGMEWVQPPDWPRGHRLVDTRYWREQLFGVADAAMSRQGRKDGLVEEGGAHQISPLVTMILTLLALTVGAVLAALTMGAIP